VTTATGTVEASAGAPVVATDVRVPRVLDFVVVKRNVPQFRDSYGHWWIEVDGDESYGWWAHRCPLRVRDVIFGGWGRLNGVGGTCAGGTPTRDPRHGEDPDFAFHPILLLPKTDAEVRAEIRTFASGHAGPWGWQWWWSRGRMTNCHTFQLDLFAAVGLTEGAELRYTRGPGCPFMYPLRCVVWRITDGLAAMRHAIHGVLRPLGPRRPDRRYGSAQGRGQT